MTIRKSQSPYGYRKLLVYEKAEALQRARGANVPFPLFLPFLPFKNSRGAR